MKTVSGDVDIDIPVRQVYNQWTQFEDYPSFMSGVKSVRQIDDTHMHWVVNVAGVEREFDAEIVEQLPDQRIAWQSLDEPQHAGVVTFHSLNDEQSRIRLQLDWNPEGIVEQVGAVLHVDDAQVARDLHRFAEMMHEKGFGSQGWRGKVERDLDIEMTASSYANNAENGDLRDGEQ